MSPRKRAFIWPWLLILCVFFASGRTTLAAPDPGFSYDKVAHFLVFGLIATAVLRIETFRRRGWGGAFLAALLVSAYGGLDEFRQSLTPGRSVEFADWVADTAGAFLAVAVYRGWRGYREILEWQLRRRRS